MKVLLWEIRIVRKNTDSILNSQDYKMELLKNERKKLTSEQKHQGDSDFYLISYYQKEIKITLTDTNTVCCERI